MATVKSIDYSRKGKNLAVNAYFVDGLGRALAGATVSVAVNNASYGSSFFTGTTSSTGQVSFNLKAQQGCYETSVSNVSSSGFPWDANTPQNGICL